MIYPTGVIFAVDTEVFVSITEIKYFYTRNNEVKIPNLNAINYNI